MMGTVELADGTWVEAQSLLPRDRNLLYQQIARRIAYYQRRNRCARMCHTRKTLSELQKLKINIARLRSRSCVPHDP